MIGLFLRSIIFIIISSIVVTLSEEKNNDDVPIVKVDCHNSANNQNQQSGSAEAAEDNLIGKSKFCFKNEANDGQWIINPHSPKKSFFCCGWEVQVGNSTEYDFLNHPEHCAHMDLNDAVKDLIYYKGNNNRLTLMGGHGCDCDSHHDRLKVSQREQYMWKPNKCELHEWNAQLFCKLLGSRTILLVGDSTMQQTAATLQNMIIYNAGNCADQIIFGRSYFLAWKEKGEDRGIHEYIHEVNPDICIFSVGGHINDEGDLLMIIDSLEKYLNDLRVELAKNNKKISFVFKTMNPAHLGCEDKKEPLISYEDYHIDTLKDRYRWVMHTHFDNIARGSAERLQADILDMSPLYLRPDGHASSESSSENDCFHYCTPGPLDLFSVLLMQKLINEEI